MKLLVTNDDGIDAPGLAALAEVAGIFGQVTVVAPDRCRSSCGHQVTTDRPLRLISHGGDRFSLDGSPADCVRLAVLQIVAEADWVLSGINDGGNLGVDVLMSGTVAAVREAALLGRKAIAFSQYRRSAEVRDWSRPARWAHRVLESILVQETPSQTFWNVNFPDPHEPDASPELVRCELDAHPLPVMYAPTPAGDEFHFRGQYHGRPRRPGSDVDVCFSGNVAISHLRVLSSI